MLKNFSLGEVDEESVEEIVDIEIKKLEDDGSCYLFFIEECGDYDEMQVAETIVNNWHLENSNAMVLVGLSGKMEVLKTTEEGLADLHE